MAEITKLHNLYRLPHPRPSINNNIVPVSPTSTLPAPLTRRASSGVPFDAASNTRRMAGWNPSRLGPTTNLWNTIDIMRARSRDEIRNNPWAASAADNFESQVIGRGFRPHWNIQDKELKSTIERKFNIWARSTLCDANGIVNFYGLQALGAREIFEGGEVFVQRIIRPIGWNKRLRTPLQVKLIPGEQCPVFRNLTGRSSATPGMPANHSVRVGIEFDADDQRAAYHMYRENPGETMFFPLGGLTYMRIPAENIAHCYKPFSTGQLRGKPHLAATISLLHELGKYTDATVVKKQIQTMFAGFIKKSNPLGGDVLPPDTETDVAGVPISSASSTPLDVGVSASKIETGTLQVLFDGEDITFPTLPAENDFASFLSVSLHQFAAGCGMTYEQITGDLRGVNLSSIRAGILDFRRKCEQFQLNIMITQFVAKIVQWWMQEAVLCGELVLPGYAEEPEQYEDIAWGMPGWPWIDPVKDAQANQMNVRSGFDSRENVVAQGGGDVATLDLQQKADNDRADSLGLVYDSRTDEVLVGRETDATTKATKPTNGPLILEEEEEEADVDPEAPGNPRSAPATTGDKSGLTKRLRS